MEKKMCRCKLKSATGVPKNENIEIIKKKAKTLKKSVEEFKKKTNELPLMPPKSNVVEMKPESAPAKTQKRSRCPKGMRKNKDGECVPKEQPKAPSPKPLPLPMMEPNVPMEQPRIKLQLKNKQRNVLDVQKVCVKIKMVNAFQRMEIKLLLLLKFSHLSSLHHLRN